MDHFSGFTAGANLGGWISQYGRYDPAHFARFIHKDDIARIAGWGMDHVRLPVDYPVLEDDAAPGVYKESGLAIIENCLDWCRAEGLNLVLDLHRAPGFSFATLAENSLFGSPVLQERFLGLWEMLARRFKDASQPELVLELMNEVVLPDSDPWNALAARAVARIRSVDPERWIMIGGNRYNSAWTLKELVRIDDPHIVYTFHFYEPMPFTHQKASWVESLKTFNQTTDYPGLVAGLAEFLKAHPEYEGELGRFRQTPMDLAYLQAMLQPALDFQNATGLPLYCGEFGAIDLSPLPSRLAWHRDFTGLLRQHGIGRAVWSYKEMGFALVRGNGKVESEELVKIVAGK